MTHRLSLTAGWLVAGMLALAGCSSTPSDTAIGLKTLPSLLSKKKTVQPTVSAEQINALLTTSNKPASIFVIEDRKAQLLLVRIESNGGYNTYGSSARQAVVLKRGKMVASRGFGGDLMSSDEGALLSLVQRRSAGSAVYVQRFLTSDNRTDTQTFDCTVKTGQTVPVVSGVVNSSGKAVTADCVGASGSFTNTYVVSSGGTVLSARQWMGDTLGYISTQALRL